MIRLSTILTYLACVYSTNESFNLQESDGDQNGLEEQPETDMTDTILPPNSSGFHVKYSIAFFDKDSGDFGGNLTFIFNSLNDSLASKVDQWGLTFVYPDPFTQMQRFMGPIRFRRYNDGVHFISINNEALAQSAFSSAPIISNFIGKAASAPTTWNDVQITNLVLRTSSPSEFKSVTLKNNTDYFIADKPKDLPSKPFGIYQTSDGAPASMEEDTLPEDNALDHRTELSLKDKDELSSDGTYLVGFQKSFTIYLVIFGLGVTSYLFGSLVRLRQRRKFRSSSRQPTTGSGYDKLK